jgi:formate hydrogenlyase subunit 3/multisubunit Na+/H+ antiporter MnhD subunit
MRPAAVVGALLLVFGVVVLALGLRYRDTKTVIDFGDLKAKVTEHRRIPDWVGVAAIAGGVLLIGVGLVSGRPASGRQVSRSNN